MPSAENFETAFENFKPSLIHPISLEIENPLARRNGRVDPAAHLRHACQAAGHLSVSKDLRKVRVTCLLDLGPFFLSFGFLPVQTVLDTFRAPGMLACPPDANQTSPFLTPDPVEDGLPGWGLQFTIWHEIELVLHEEVRKAAMVDPFLTCSTPPTGCPMIHWL